MKYTDKKGSDTMLKLLVEYLIIMLITISPIVIIFLIAAFIKSRYKSTDSNNCKEYQENSRDD